IDPRCADTAAARGLDPVLARLARYAAAEREAQGDLAVAGVGLLTTLTGIAALTRPLPYGSRGERSQSGRPEHPAGPGCPGAWRERDGTGRPAPARGVRLPRDRAVTPGHATLRGAGRVERPSRDRAPNLAK